MAQARHIDRLTNLAEEGETLTDSAATDAWKERARLAIKAAYPNEPEHVQRFDDIRYSPSIWTDGSPPSYFEAARRRGVNKAVAMLRAFAEDLADGTAEARPLSPPSGNGVFVVHGHDTALRDRVARLCGRLGLQPIILGEQANEGKTLIEKFEKHALDVGFAIVLLTPDDMAYGEGEGPDEATPRARQNVILELGYFMGSLGRARTAAVYASGTDLPSDIHGLAYIEVTASLEMNLAKEMRQAGMAVDLNDL